MHFPLRLMALMLTALVLSACQQSEEAAVQGMAPVVKTVVLTQTDQPGWSLAGTLEARYVSNLAFRVGGKVGERLVNEGDSVTPGQLLLRLDDSDFVLAVQRSAANVTALQAQVRNSEAEWQRLKALLPRNLTSQQVVDQAFNQLKVLQAQLKAAEVAVQEAQNQLAYSRLQAPAAGVVDAVRVEAGEVVAAGQPVAILVEQGSREVEVQVPENRLAGLPKQANAVVGEQRFAVTLRSLMPQADAASRTWQARFSLPETAQVSGLALGSSVRLQFAEANSAVRVPSTALYEQGDFVSLWQVKDGKVQRVPVKVKQLANRWAWVEGDFSGVERIVSLGVHQLNEGQAVRESAE
ncbi:efflux RND transporter periplasmic adaptor subunit [Thiomicrorhabdus cannonii]|uniref:efflux RND transporter periplasmic adaptor subunit n=1 Tax=Thiomicrorhabdus cannonii TaxID=2748011 RepID=UPI0015BEA3B5|nr:efflux RND transporter periplasmic adaptor subunit [Thiomicrorhabdus cannonii]